MTQCPCGSQNKYALCCGQYLEQNKTPDAPEQLMRSRYTAYSLANIDYIKKTMQGKALVGFNEQAAEKWAKKVCWLGLEVKQSYMETPTKGFVEFRAHFLEHNQVHTIHELSEFHQINASWFYVDGIHRQSDVKHQKISRTSPCPCGSGKKFKNCHEK